MPKVIDYPRSSFKTSLELADSVSYLGGTCSIQTCADNMGLKVSGAFNATIASAQKFGLVEQSKGNLSITPLYKEIHFSYTEEEKSSNLIKAFLLPPLFNKIYERFKGKELPTHIISKIFVKEYGIQDINTAQRVSNYFIDGCQMLGLIENNKLVDVSKPLQFENETSEVSLNEESSQNVPKMVNSRQESIHSLSNSFNEFVINISGPGMNVTITINDEDDISMVETTMNKIKKILSKRESDN